jgi:hypothetical protein
MSWGAQNRSRNIQKTKTGVMRYPAKGVTAGDESLQMFVAGVHGVPGEYASSARKTPIDYNVQRMRKESEVENENENLSSTLEAEKERSLVDRAEKLRVLEANKELTADCERTDDARYASASATAYSKNSKL